MTSGARTIDDSRAAGLGRMLLAAERTAVAVAPLSDELPDLTLDDAYAVQRAYADLRRAEGGRVVGRKVGATNPVIQRLFGVDQPDFGVLFADMVADDGATLPSRELIAPRIEVETGFLLERDLAGPGVTAVDVLLATRALVACLEVIDSRIVDWRIRIADTVADNGSSARCVVGRRIVPPGDLDLRVVGAVLERNGEVVSTGAGAAVLGHPASAVAWLANTLAAHDEGLEAGMLVLPSAMTTAVEARPGDRFEASLTWLGRVSCAFA